MKVIILEDEAPAANRLSRMLHNIREDIEIVKVLDSVETSVKYLPDAAGIDLIFMDIQLADGISFCIFDQIKLSTPVIFTTAYDQHALKAFKVNSLDYLLKPIDEKELRQALEKYRELYPRTDKGISEKMERLVQKMDTAPYKERLLIKRGRQLHYLNTEATAYYYADGKLCYAIDFNGKQHLLEYNLSQLEELLAPNRFYRINRHLLVNIVSIQKIHTWLGGRLKLELLPPATADTTVSRERVSGFKDWLGQ
ncbi:MAG TPA: LytTR family DNA-binding domain-containing protein [Puia sp.]